jgi:hypothetical protein
MASREWIVSSVGRETFELLASRLPLAELKSLLIEVLRERARTRSGPNVLEQYRADGFCRPAAVDQRLSVAIDGELLAAAMGFEAIELSPLAPLAGTSSFALTDQNRVVSTCRGTEVVSDTTNVLALECAERLRRAPGATIHLATSQRVVRAQPFPKLPGYAPHFRLFALASAGIERKDHALIIETLTRHVRTLLAALERLENRGYTFGARRLELLATEDRAVLADRIAANLQLDVRRELLQHPYYSAGLRFKLSVTTPDGQELPLADGGAFDWVARLTSNRRAVFVASGLGAQLVPLFRSAKEPDAGQS